MSVSHDVAPAPGGPEGDLGAFDGIFAGERPWRAERLAALLPGPELAAELAAGDLDASSDEALLAAVVGFRRQAAWAEAGAAMVAAALSHRPAMNPEWPAVAGRVSVTDVTAEELAPALGCSRQAARRLVRDGRAFEGSLAATGDALARGELDVPRARVLVDALAEEPPALAWEVQDQVLGGEVTRTVSQLQRAVAKALVIADPGGASDRCRAAAERRRVDRPRPAPDGMARWSALLPAADAMRMDTTLDALARTGRAAGDERTLDQLRADLLADLVLGRVPSTPGGRVEARAEPSEASGPGEPRRGPVRARIDVLVPWEVLAGISEEPGFLAGYGPIPAPVARELASDGTWRRILTDPPDGSGLDVGRTRYRPPAHLAEHVRARDRWCARPGCSARAETCDLDHTAEWDRDDGRTAHDNLGPLCERDHQVKTHGGAQMYQPDPGVFYWRSPLGRLYRVVPGEDGYTLVADPDPGVPPF
ncbi:MAG: HNH endonuclease [Actinomycetales bacterium]|nr:HNH endonuclease [Actinomycetales bacterium]